MSFCQAELATSVPRGEGAQRQGVTCVSRLPVRQHGLEPRPHRREQQNFAALCGYTPCSNSRPISENGNPSAVRPAALTPYFVRRPSRGHGCAFRPPVTSVSPSVLLQAALPVTNSLSATSAVPQISGCKNVPKRPRNDAGRADRGRKRPKTPPKCPRNGAERESGGQKGLKSHTERAEK